MAQILAATHPERVRSLTLTNSDTDENFPPEAFLPIHELASQGLLAAGMAALATDPTAIRTALDTSLEHPECIPDATLLGFFAPFTTADRAEALQECIASMEPSEMTAIRDGLARFAKPMLIVWGADDVFFPVKWARWLEATIPGVTRSVTVEGARLFFRSSDPWSSIGNCAGSGTLHLSRKQTPYPARSTWVGLHRFGGQDVEDRDVEDRGVQFMNATVSLGQGTIPYRYDGQGPPIVFAHGLLVDGQLWRGYSSPNRQLSMHRARSPPWGSCTTIQ